MKETIVLADAFKQALRDKALVFFHFINGEPEGENLDLEQEIEIITSLSPNQDLFTFNLARKKMLSFFANNPGVSYINCVEPKHVVSMTLQKLILGIDSPNITIGRMSKTDFIEVEINAGSLN